MATFTVKPSVNYSPTLVDKLPNSSLVIRDTTIIYPDLDPIVPRQLLWPHRDSLPGVEYRYNSHKPGTAQRIVDMAFNKLLLVV